MKIRLTIPRRFDAILNRMAQEAGVGVDDLARVAMYNIVALYCTDKEIDPSILIPDLAHPRVVPGVELVDDVAGKAL